MSLFIGIDVAKRHLDVALSSGETIRLAHDEAGLTTLLERLRPLAPALVVLEATGGLQVRAAARLAAAGLPVAVVNPRQVRDFARATGQLAKTDRLDAQAIARFAQSVQPTPRPLRRLRPRRRARPGALPSRATTAATTTAARVACRVCSSRPDPSWFLCRPGLPGRLFRESAASAPRRHVSRESFTWPRRRTRRPAGTAAPPVRRC